MPRGFPRENEAYLSPPMGPLLITPAEMRLFLTGADSLPIRVRPTPPRRSPDTSPHRLSAVFPDNVKFFGGALKANATNKPFIRIVLT